MKTQAPRHLDYSVHQRVEVELIGENNTQIGLPEVRGAVLRYEPEAPKPPAGIDGAGSATTTTQEHETP